MTKGRIYFFNTLDPNRPIEEKYIAEVDGKRMSFVHEEEALLFLFDNGVKMYKYLTKEAKEYVNLKTLPTYEFWHIENRVGHILHGFESYIDDQNIPQKRKAFVWRFVGFGRSCFAPTQEELKEKVTKLIYEYQEDVEERGYNTYPFYTRYYRNQVSVK
ncbi:hypothetical protein ACWF7H_20235 [Peribacillus butanolivorans]|uniref:hypothetical protein n=1 Tax=Peribacillus butanolivorans TaxID=421767 RepID=UPI00368BD92B